jgi:hemolysin activation/secretion protein
VDQAFSDAFEERTVGGFFLASYPFSKFRRLEVHTTLEYSDRVDVDDVLFFDVINDPEPVSRTRKGWISTNHVSYVKDNTLWLPTGPIDGVRWNFSAGVSTDLTRARAENFILLADMRRYFRTSLLSAYAVRLFGYYSDGAIPERIAFGGPYTLRLYPFLGFVGSRVWLLSQEWRFPIMHGIALTFPFGTIRFPGIQGSAFVDLSQLWLETREPEGVWGSWGFGFRMPILFPLVLRLDVGKRFTLGDLPTNRIAGFNDTEVDFFIGFNY